MKYFLRDVESAVEVGGLTPNSDPILIIGAGLSAADAIISAQVTVGTKPVNQAGLSAADAVISAQVTVGTKPVIGAGLSTTDALMSAQVTVRTKPVI